MIFRLFPARWPALLFIAFFTGLFLVGCQANEEIPWATVAATTAGGTDAPLAVTTVIPFDPPVIPSLPPTESPVLVLRGQTIEFWHPWQGELAKQAEEAVTDFNKKNEWGITVKIRPLYSQGALVDAVATTSKDNSAGLPQVVAATSEQLAVWSKRDNSIVGLDSYIANPKNGLSAEESKAFTPAFWSQDQTGGQQIAIPALRNARVLFYNETWAKELGFSGPPKTPAEFKKQACTAAQKNNTSGVLEKYGTGGWIIDDDPLTTLSWFSVFGSKPVPDEEGKTYSFQGKEAEATFAFLRGLLEDGCAWLAKDTAPYDYFTQRMALFYSGSLDDLPVQSLWNQKFKSKDSWKILPFMGVDGQPVVLSSGYSYAILQSSPEAKMAAWLFIRWMEQPAVAAKLVEAQPSLPVDDRLAAQLNAAKTSFPWSMILPITETARPAPALASWPGVRRLVEDATWQLFHAPAENVPKILPDLEQAVQDVTTN